MNERLKLGPLKFTDCGSATVHDVFKHEMIYDLDKDTEAWTGKWVLLGEIRIPKEADREK